MIFLFSFLRRFDVAMIFLDYRIEFSMKSYKLHNFRFNYCINATINHDVEDEKKKKSRA